MDDLMLLLAIIGVVAILVFIILGFVKKNKSHFKKAGISLAVAIIGFVGFGLTYDDDEDVEAEQPEQEQVVDNNENNKEEEKKKEQEEKEERAKKEAEKEKAKKEQVEAEQKEKEEQERKENEIPENIENLRVTDVRNDKTGNWRKVVDSKNFNMPENAITYYEEYMKDGEIHFLVSFATNTTTMINDLGGMLFVNITEYEEKEEHSADTIGNGMVLKSYNIYKDSGEIEEIEE